MKDKKFDAVKLMRKIRDELSKKYLKNPELEKKICREFGLNTTSNSNFWLSKWLPHVF